MAAMAIIACAASCKTVQLEETGTQLTITASTEVGGTKTTLKDNSVEVYWQPGDEIKLFSGSGSGRFVSTLSSEAKTSEFTGTLGFVFGVSEGGDGAGTLVALYPYSAAANFDGTAISTTLPGAQTGKAGSFAPGQFISVARSSGSLMMYFYNVLGGVRFSLKQEGISTVTFRGNDDEVLGGAITVGWGDDGYPVVTEASDTVKTLTITAPDGETFAVGEYYYISALPKSLAKGYTMTFAGDSKTGTYTTATPVTIRRSAFGTLTEADRNVTYEEAGGTTPAGKNIQFADDAAKYACVEKFDIDGDGEISYEEAAAVTDVTGLFTNWYTVKSFDEFQYFTSVKDVPNRLFYKCNDLESTKLPASIQSIGDYAFYGCRSLVSIEIPNGVMSIGNSAFQFCGITDISLPSTVKIIGSCAFYEAGIKSVVLPDSVTSLGTSVFGMCAALTSVVLSSGLTSIPNHAFDGCDSLETITLPTSLTTIGDYAFYNCRLYSPDTYVSKIELPSTVTKIGNYCFNAVGNIIIPSTSIVEISAATFSKGVRIYVPAANVAKYKPRTYWSNFANYIFPISDYSDPVKISFEAVDLGLSVKWANMNLGASDYAEDCGDYYAWGETGTKIDYSFENYKYCNGSAESLNKYCNDSSYGVIDDRTTLESSDDVATQKLGNGWRIPTKSEWEELSSNCKKTWVLGVLGYLMTSTKDGYTDKSIFLPAAGYRTGADICQIGSGNYWSSTLYASDARHAYQTTFSSSNSMLFSWDYGSRCCGNSVRPVQDY